MDFSKDSREVRQKWFWLSSNCRVILVWKLTLATGSLRPNTDDSCWKWFFCQILYPFCAKAAMTIIHGLQANATQTIWSANLKVFQLQYKFKLTVRTNRLNKMRCKFTLIRQIQRMYSLIYLSLKVFNQSSTLKLK